MTYAGFWKRFAAYFIDAIILGIPSFVFFQSVFHFGFSTGMSFILGFLYKPFFESSKLNATPGKALMGLAVVNESGQNILFKQACLRFFCAYLSAFIFFVGYLMQIFTAKRQTLHDMLSETLVIERPSSVDINYFTVWKEKFKEIVNQL